MIGAGTLFMNRTNFFLVKNCPPAVLVFQLGIAFWNISAMSHSLGAVFIVIIIIIVLVVQHGFCKLVNLPGR